MKNNVNKTKKMIKMSNQFIIKYNPCFKKADLVTVKLKSVSPKGEELYITFNKEGVETLLYVFEDFNIAVESLEINKTNFNLWKKYFKKVLGHGPLEKWKKLSLQTNFYMNTVISGNITEYGFDQLKRDFIKLYCTSMDPKGEVIEYLKTDKCLKPHEKSVTDHQDRMEEIMQYSTKLEGAQNDLSTSEMKTIIFKLFPIAWQINYKKSQPAIQGVNMEAIMIFMSQEKEFDNQHRKQSSRWQERGSDRG